MAHPTARIRHEVSNSSCASFTSHPELPQPENKSVVALTPVIVDILHFLQHTSHMPNSLFEMYTFQEIS